MSLADAQADIESALEMLKSQANRLFSAIKQILFLMMIRAI